MTTRQYLPHTLSCCLLIISIQWPVLKMYCIEMLLGSFPGMPFLGTDHDARYDTYDITYYYTFELPLPFYWWVGNTSSTAMFQWCRICECYQTCALNKACLFTAQHCWFFCCSPAWRHTFMLMLSTSILVVAALARYITMLHMPSSELNK